MLALLKQYLPTILQLLFAIFSAVALPVILKDLPGLTSNLFKWTAAKAAGVKSAYVREVLQRANDLLCQKVLAFEQTSIAAIKIKMAAGQLTPDQLPGLLANVKAAALAEFHSSAGATGLSKLLLEVFAGSDTAMNTWLQHELESIVFRLPASGTEKSPGLPTAPPVPDSNLVTAAAKAGT